MTNIPAFNESIHPELEPGVINNEMIEDAFRKEYKGEAGRLRQEEDFSYEKIEYIRLDFRNIIRVDHLWVLPNLTKLCLSFNKLEQIENIEMLTNLRDLDLSFNYIEKIENLETLKKLKILSLYNNFITQIENLDDLENLLILSLGNNKIATVKGIERFRFFKNLKVLNMEGNPIAENPEFPLNLYIAALLTNVKYYKYVFISDKDREEGKERFVREIREINNAEETEIRLRAKLEKEKADEERLSSSFVEHLNEHQLFESIWANDADGNAFRKIGEEAEEMIDQYSEDFFEITQKIYLIGVERNAEREKELEEYENCVAVGQNKVQKQGQKLVEAFIEFNENACRHAKNHYVKLDNLRQQGLDNSSPEIVTNKEEIEKIYEELLKKCEDLWLMLMEQEIYLFESVEEVMASFERNINDMLGQFIEQVRTLFAYLHDIAQTFCDSLQDAVLNYLTIALAKGDKSKVPVELHECLEDKDTFFNMVIGMRDFHLATIDYREELLYKRSGDWIQNLIDTKKKEEMERNRNKLNEINYFLVQVKEHFEELQVEVMEEMHKDVEAT